MQHEKLLIAHDVIDFSISITGLGDILLFRIFSEAYGEGRKNAFNGKLEQVSIELR